MLALSIRQPWAWLILHGGKAIENRTWPTKVRGRVLIHASAGMTRLEYRQAREFQQRIRLMDTFPFFDELRRGGFVGSVEIAGCVTASDSPWFQGPYGFVLRDPRPMLFVPYKGRLGFFEVPDSDVGQSSLWGARWVLGGEPDLLLLR